VPFTDGSGTTSGRNVCITLREATQRDADAYLPVVETHESAYTWHDVEVVKPFFECPDIFGQLRGLAAVGRLLPPPDLQEPNRNCTPVRDGKRVCRVAHFKFVPTRRRSCRCLPGRFRSAHSYVDFTITFKVTRSVDRRHRQHIPGIKGGLRHRGDQKLPA